MVSVLKHLALLNHKMMNRTRVRHPSNGNGQLCPIAFEPCAGRGAGQMLAKHWPSWYSHCQCVSEWPVDVDRWPVTVTQSRLVFHQFSSAACLWLACLNVNGKLISGNIVKSIPRAWPYLSAPTMLTGFAGCESQLSPDKCLN